MSPCSEPTGVGRRGVRGAFGIFPAAVNWLLSTYAEPTALRLAQDKFSRATLAGS